MYTGYCHLMQLVVGALSLSLGIWLAVSMAREDNRPYDKDSRD